MYGKKIQQGMIKTTNTSFENGKGSTNKVTCNMVENKKKTKETNENNDKNKNVINAK